MLQDFLFIQGSWIGHEHNVESALHLDTLYWLVRVLDQKITGEHNASVEDMRSPKVNKPIPPKFNIQLGETFANTVMPPRLRKLYGVQEVVINDEIENDYWVNLANRVNIKA